MNCSECKNLLIEYAEGLLDGHPKEGVEQHLEKCSQCRKEVENIRVLQDRIIKNGLDFRSIDFEDRVMDRIARERNIRLKAASSAGFFHQIRSLFMKNAVLKIATAAVVVLAVLIGLNFFQIGVSFARVAEPILHARTLEYDVVTLEYGTYHDFVAEGKIRRSLRNLSRDLIIDVDNSSVLNLDTVHKTAAIAKAETKAAKSFFDINRDFLRLVRSAVGKALNDAPSAVEKLGKKTIDGHGVFGFKLQSGTDGEEVVIWADRDTALPVQIDIRLGMSHQKSLTTESGPSTPGGPTRKGVLLIPMDYTLKNIRFDVPVDESLMEMPSDYKLVDWEQFPILSMENSFLKMLRLWSEKLSDGFFPENLPPANMRSQYFSVFPSIMKWTPEERDKLITDEVLRIIGPEHVKKHFLKNLDPEEWEEFSINVFDGLSFISNLENSGTELRYSGSGVRLGEGTREIFRYRMPDSPSLRVIYGDLHVEAFPADHAWQ
jgi:hypothetical protein